MSIFLRWRVLLGVFAKVSQGSNGPTGNIVPTKGWMGRFVTNVLLSKLSEDSLRCVFFHGFFWLKNIYNSEIFTTPPKFTAVKIDPIQQPQKLTCLKRDHVKRKFQCPTINLQGICWMVFKGGQSTIWFENLSKGKPSSIPLRFHVVSSLCRIISGVIIAEGGGFREWKYEFQRHTTETLGRIPRKSTRHDPVR